MPATIKRPKPATDPQAVPVVDASLVVEIEKILSDAGPSLRDATQDNFHIDGQLQALRESLDRNNLSRRDHDRNKARLEATRVQFNAARRRDGVLQAVALEDRLREGLAASGERLCVLLDLRASHALTPALLSEMRQLEGFRDGAQRVRSLVAHGKAELRELLPPGIGKQVEQMEALSKWVATAPTVSGEAGKLVSGMCARIRLAAERTEAAVTTEPWDNVSAAIAAAWQE